MHMLRKDEAHYLKIVQPWQDEVSYISLQVNENLVKFKATQMTIASLLEEPTTVVLVETTQECVEQMEQDLTRLQYNFMSFTKKITDMHDSQKNRRKKTVGGSRMSHS